MSSDSTGAPSPASCSSPFVLLAYVPPTAAATCDPGDEQATVAHLRTDCTGHAVCQTSFDEMSNWINGHAAVGSGTALSPFFWQASPDPPTSLQPGPGGSFVRSTDGHDMFVETDCSLEGDCEAAGSETHLMLYNETRCGSANPWFDAVTNRCRNDDGS